MNTNITDQLPIFNNIFEAIQFISNLDKNAGNVPSLMPPTIYGRDPFVAFGANLNPNDFIFTPLQCNYDDVSYYKMLALNDSIPYQTDFIRYSLKPNLFHTNFLYRGQNADYKSIKANLFRNENKTYFLDDIIKVNELSAIIAMHPLVQLLGIKGFELRGKPTKFQTNLYGLAQHYYNKTSEVDFSSSLEIAAFFAVTKYDSVHDKYLPVEYDAESTGVLYALPIYKSLTDNLIYGCKITSIGKQFCFERPTRQLGFLINCAGGKDLIDHPFLLRFEFRHNRTITENIYKTMDCGNAIAPSDPLENYWRQYRDIKDSQFSISNKAIELNLYHNPTETYDSLVNKILSYKDETGNSVFRLTGETWPKFPRDILKEYWADIKNGWWEDVYCKDIYFPNSNKSIIEELRALPSDSRYRSAFYEK